MTAEVPVGFCTVGAHGNSQGVFNFETNDLLLPDELDKVLLAAGCQPNQPVRLYACETGKGDNPFGQRFANYRYTDVQAPEVFGNMETGGSSLYKVTPQLPY